MTTKRTVWISAVITILAAAVSMAQVPKDEGQPAQKTDKAAQPMMQCPMMASMKGMKTFAGSPAVLLSQADELGLTEGQRKQLEEIERTAREKAREVLTAKQQDKLKEMPEGRLSMMDLCMMRMNKMMGHKEHDREEGMMCPMCMKMMQMRMQSNEKK